MLAVEEPAFETAKSFSAARRSPAAGRHLLFIQPVAEKFDTAIWNGSMDDSVSVLRLRAAEAFVEGSGSL
jgi:hypothetical protein